MADIITELSMHNSRHEERKTAMHHLLKLCRTEQPEEMWLEHFKNVLLLLLETLNDDDVSVHLICCMNGALLRGYVVPCVCCRAV